MLALPRYSLNSRGKINKCALCGRSRSRHYRESTDPEPLICSKCAKSNEHKGNFKTVIIEIHNHCCNSLNPEAHFTTTHVAEVAEKGPLNRPTELLGDIPFIPYLQRHGTGQLSPIREESPPPVNSYTKPTVRN
ncbi:hypothetical protein CC78DRAFT_586279 [Lojkania enalia]|uniref:Uncharacterized protein n=1 Tax=Lojkania enalia TaxID=147567 RepID=A0A9P4K2W1_9PLEO|nr:hypothetical protein CC78DRAFT_586279 [Didymosphaeria enalia]